MIRAERYGLFVEGGASIPRPGLKELVHQEVDVFGDSGSSV